MMKYMYCIFLIALLMSGLSRILDNDVHKFRSRVGAMEMQSQSVWVHHTPVAIIQQACNEHRDIKTEVYHCKTGDGVSVNVLKSRTVAPSKTLRLSASLSAILTLCTLDSRLHKKKRKDFTLDKIPVPFSNKYFVCTLKRILI